MITLKDLSIPTENRANGWGTVESGVVIFPRLIDDDLIDRYCAEWEKANGYQCVDDLGVIHAANRGGYDEVGYMQYPVLRELCCDSRIAEVLQSLLGEPAGVHLNLSGWVSTERDFHQDGYLNEDCVGDFYAAIWIALDDIDPNSGPFQYVPGSQRWGYTITKQGIGQVVNLEDPMWPKHSEEFLSPLVEDEIKKRNAEIISYLPNKGDVLIWDPLLFHRGSHAAVPGHMRKALIAHYSGKEHRTDMPPALQTTFGGWLFPLNPTGRAGMML